MVKGKNYNEKYVLVLVVLYELMEIILKQTYQKLSKMYLFGYLTSVKLISRLYPIVWEGFRYT